MFTSKEIFLDSQNIFWFITDLGYSNFQAFMLRVKNKIQVKIFQPRLIHYFLCLLALIDEKEVENQPRFKSFNLNIILTCNIYTHQQIW